MSAGVDSDQSDRRSRRSPGGIADVRSPWRTVALPSEHGGWGLTVEPALLGLVAVWSWSGVLLAVVGLLGFLARTPLKVVLVDRHRKRSLGRTRLALRILVVELLAIAALVAVVASVAPATTWPPFLLAAPLFAVELWFEARSHGRRLIPELAGAVGIGSIAAAIVLAGDGEAAVAAGAWTVVAARAAASIPFVRFLVQRRHGHVAPTWHVVVAQVSALFAVAAAWAIGWVTVAAVVAISALVAIQLIGAHRDPPEIKVIGITQTLLGIAVAVLAGLGLRTM